MTLATQSELIEKLAELRELSPEVRFGQLLANLGFLVEDQSDRSLWEVEYGVQLKRALTCRGTGQISDESDLRSARNTWTP